MKTLFDKDNRLISCAFLLCFVYWTWLFFGSQMDVKFDAIGFEELGLIIHQEGWQSFFKMGPHREPMYPFLIAFAMDIAKLLSVSYQSVLKIIQFGFLFSAQILLLVLLRQCQIHKVIQAVVVFYYGISPAIVNSAASLYSEIASLPWVILAILFATKAWRRIHVETKSKVSFYAFWTAVGFLGAIFVKGIFQYTFYIFMLPFAAIALIAFQDKNARLFQNTITYVLVTAVLVVGSVFVYKSLHKKYSGYFAFSTRPAPLLFGNVYKRTNAMTFGLWAAHIAAVPGGGVCRSIFTDEVCRYTEFHFANHFRKPMLLYMIKDIPKEEQSREVYKLAFEAFSRRPIQYVALTALEALKMPFWESTKVGMVFYPPPLENLFGYKPFRSGIRLALALITFAALFSGIAFIYKNKNHLIDYTSQDSFRLQALFLSLWVIVVFTALYALFSVHVRYAFPIVSLFLLFIAHWLQKLFFERDR